MGMGAQHPKRLPVLTSPIASLGVDFIPRLTDGKNSQRSRLHASPALIVNSVNEVILINFRAGSHMTFSSIFPPDIKNIN